MPLTKHIRRYSPLSIEDKENDDSRTLPSSRYHLILPLRCAALFFITCILAIVMLFAMHLFHSSLSNLIHDVLGAKSKTSTVEAVCLNGNRTVEMKRVSIDDLMSTSNAQFNRQATPISKSFGVKTTSNGFIWDNEDATTTKWRPQGVTTHHSSNSRYVLVSWYGRKDEGYANRGGRISFVDVSEMPHCPSTSCSYPYVHVLLVDSNMCTLPDIHVGGIEQFNDKLYVADSRSGMQRIIEFDITNNLFEVPSEMNDSMFGYRYLLRQSASFQSSIKPSFLSYDADSEKFLIGTYARCGPRVGIHVDSEKCLMQPKNQLVWLSPNDAILQEKTDVIEDQSLSCWHYFSEMQGAASLKFNNRTLIFISSSYGPIADSHLHVVNMSSTFIDECSQSQHMNDFDLSKVRIYNYPPGLEDLHKEHLEEQGLYIWMVTEFGTRMVISTLLNDIILSAH